MSEFKNTTAKEWMVSFRLSSGHSTPIVVKCADGLTYNEVEEYAKKYLLRNQDRLSGASIRDIYPPDQI